MTSIAAPLRSRRSATKSRSSLIRLASRGLEVLAELKSDGDLLTIPVVVLSSSRHPTDVDRSYALHANGYIVKPVGLDDFVGAIKTIDACFLRLIEPSLPGDQPDPQHPVLDI